MNKILFILLFFTLSFAQTRIQDLQALNSLKNGDLFLITQDNTSLTPGQYNGKKLTYSNLYTQLKDSIFDELVLPTFVRTFGTQYIDGSKTFAQNIITEANKGIYSLNYRSGLTSGAGWAILRTNPIYGTTIEADNMIVRGSLFAKEFLVNQTRVSPGDFMVSEGATIASIVEETSGGLRTLDGGRIFTVTGDSIARTPFTKRAYATLIDPYGKEITPFAKGDLIEIQKYYPGRTQIINRVRGEIVEVRGNIIEFAYAPTSYATVGDATIRVGDVIVRRGSTSDGSRQGSIIMSINAPNTPFIDVIDGVDSFEKLESPDVLKARIGNLKGINSPQWGLLTIYGGYFPSGTLYAENAFISGKIIVGGGDVDSLLSIQYSEINSKLDSAGVGDLAFEDLVSLAKLDSTIIDQGYIKTSLIETSALAVTGYGTFGDYQDSVNAAIQTKLDSTGIRSLAYEDIVNIALLDTTIIIGGQIKTILVNTSALAIRNFTLGELLDEHSDSLYANKQTADSAKAAAQLAQNVADSKIRTWYKATNPYTDGDALTVGDIWVHTSDFYTMYRYLGSGVWDKIIGYGVGIGTYIDGTGVYTRKLVAGQVDADSITTGKLRVNIIDADSINIRNGQKITVAIDGISDSLGTIFVRKVTADMIETDSLTAIISDLGTVTGTTSFNGEVRIGTNILNAWNIQGGFPIFSDIGYTIRNADNGSSWELNVLRGNETPTQGSFQILTISGTDSEGGSISIKNETGTEKFFVGKGALRHDGYISTPLYKASGVSGLTATKTWSDADSTHTVTIQGGIITGWSTVANSPSVASKTSNNQNNIFAILPKNLEFNQKNSYNKLTNLRLK